MSEEQQECDNTPGIIGWNELITPNKKGSIEFYSKLMGWETESMDLPGGETYTMFNLAGRPVGGCYQAKEELEMPPMWMSYINVENLDATTSKACELGATIVKERVDLPMGSFVIIADPQGAVISFWKNAGMEC